MLPDSRLGRFDGDPVYRIQVERKAVRCIAKRINKRVKFAAAGIRFDRNIVDLVGLIGALTKKFWFWVETEEMKKSKTAF